MSFQLEMLDFIFCVFTRNNYFCAIYLRNFDCGPAHMYSGWTPLRLFGLSILQHLLCACIFWNKIRRNFWCQLSGLTPTHTPSETAKLEFQYVFSRKCNTFFKDVCPQLRKDVLKTIWKKITTLTWYKT